MTEADIDAVSEIRVRVAVDDRAGTAGRVSLGPYRGEMADPRSGEVCALYVRPELITAVPARDAEAGAEAAGRAPCPAPHALRCPISRGFASSPSSPCHARFTRWAATSAFFGLRTLSHHWPVRATMPTRAWA